MTEQDDAAFARTFITVLVVLVVTGLVLVMLSRFIVRATSGPDPVEAVAERIAPVGQVNLGEPIEPGERPGARSESTADQDTATESAETGDAETEATTAEAEPAPAKKAGAPAAEEVVAEAGRGKEVYESACFVCHASAGVGAPVLGEEADWQARVAQGMDVLYDHAINGYQGENGVMPAKGGRADLSDADVQAAVDYMVAESGGLPEDNGGGDAESTAADVVAAESPAAEPKADTAGGQGSEAKATGGAKAAGEAQATDDAKTAGDAQATDDGKAAGGAQAAGDGKPAGEAQAAAEAGAADETGGEQAAAEEAAAGEAATAAAAAEGKKVYDTACFICHASGAAGAPKHGDAAAWEPRLTKGKEVLYDHAVNGFMGDHGLMPPKGGRTDLSDEQVRAAVDYMVDAVQ